jgi:hypothetical protein
MIMPDLPLLDPEGNPLGRFDTFLIVRSIMAWPNDIESALSYRALGNAGLSEMFKQATLKLAKSDVGGTITASVFLHLLQLKIYRPQDASFNKAVFLVSRGLEKLRPHHGRAAPIDRIYVRKFWTKFRPAAHLWGAAQWLSEMGMSPETEEEIEAFPSIVIQIADALLAAAMAAELNFDPDPWRLPVAYPRLSPRISLPPVSAEVVALLEKYHSPDRREPEH